MRNLLAAEFLKLRTVRTPWALLVTTVTLSGLAVASTVLVADSAGIDLESANGARDVLGVSVAGAIFVLVLGIIISAGEYRHGTAIDTFLTTPRRPRVIAVKLATALTTGGIFGLLASGTALATALLMYRVRDLGFPLGPSTSWSTLGATALYAALFCGIGAATGSLVRNQVVAIVGWLSWMAVVEHIAEGFFPSFGRWLPMGAGRALVGGIGTPDLLSPATAAVVLIAYAAVIMAAAIVWERYRDA